MLEPIFIRRLTFESAFEVGLIEEFAKILGVIVVARHHRHDSEIDGVILGGAAGMGFAALESSGYVFTAFVQSGGSLSALVIVTLLRGLLSPFGHGTWTAILASVLFREGRPDRFRINRALIAAYSHRGRPARSVGRPAASGWSGHRLRAGRLHRPGRRGRGWPGDPVVPLARSGAARASGRLRYARRRLGDLATQPATRRSRKADPPARGGRTGIPGPDDSRVPASVGTASRFRPPRRLFPDRGFRRAR